MPSNKQLSPEELEKALEEIDARAESKIPGWSHLWARRARQLRAHSAATGDSDEAPEVYAHGLDVEGGGRCLSDTRMPEIQDRKSTRLNSSHVAISYAVFCLK